ncbi:DNA translocase FtsK 4TM domain-containing protein [Ferruginibacter sp.]
MASKTKPVKSKAANPDQLKQEKEEAVQVKQLLKDERTHKIAGSILLLIAILLFIAFTSYLFTWAEDQDKFSYRMLLANDIKVQNLLGTFGAFISEIFVRKGFGIASYLICTLFFVIGVNLFFGKKVFSVSKNIKYLIAGLPVISVAAAVVFSGQAFPWGGAVGDMSKDWMYKTIGQIGTIGVLVVAVLSYVIWRFNPVFKLPSKQDFITPPISNTVADTNEIDETDDDTDEEVDTIKINSLKGEGNVLVIAPLENTMLNHDITLVEKENQIPNITDTKELLQDDEDVKPLITTSKVKDKNITPLELEIKTVPEKIDEEEEQIIINSKLPNAKPYDPILDLRDYKFPTLDLLENHGSEKIVQDANELENNKNQIINTLKLRHSHTENFCNCWPYGYIV